MPWTETHTMQRHRFILACQSGEYSISHLCREFGISRKTAYKWLQRFDPRALSSLDDRSHACHTQPNRTPGHVADALLAVKQAHPHWGPAVIRRYFLNLDPAWTVPAASTIGNILRQHGLVRPANPRRKSPVRQVPLRDVSDVNQTWGADFKGKFLLSGGDGRWCHAFTLTDLHSRQLLCCEAGAAETGAFVRACLEQAFRENGLPEVIRTDNGNPFAGTGLGGLTPLSVWLIKLGILPERIRPGKPTENGRHERMHRTLKEAMSYGHRYGTLEEQQAWFNAFREEYNTVRPHSAVGGAVPSSLWRKSEREYTGEVPEVAYDEGAKLYRVQQKGDISLQGKRLFVSESLRGEWIEIREEDEGATSILFGGKIPGYYEAASHSIRRYEG